MARYLYFRTSRSTYQQVTELFDFVWSTSAALWNLRWQVTGLSQVIGNVTNETLHGRFIAGSGIHSASLRKTCLEMTWEQQQQQFAKFLLMDLFALYEGWLAATLSIVNKSSAEKELQFPTYTKRNGTKAGVSVGLAQCATQQSLMLKNAFHFSLSNHSKNSMAKIENLLVAYRCFKEYRNVLMHNGGIADAKCVSAHTAFLNLTAASLGVAERPIVEPVTLGSAVLLSLRGVVGFSELILRLVATLDAELACMQGAEKEFHDQWIIHFSAPERTKKSRYMLSTDSAKRETQVRNLVAKLGLPRPSSTLDLELYLRSKSLVL